MNKTIIRIIYAALVSGLVSGCASQPGRGASFNPLCTLAGAVVGGGGAAAISIAAGPIGAGVAAGAMLGTLACQRGAPAQQQVATTSEQTTTHVPPPAPGPEMDSDGDGVVDRLDHCPGTPAGTKVDSNGCPEILMTLTGVNFAFDKSTIETASGRILDQAVETLAKAPSVNVRIVGHTDSTGPDDYNLKLSERRASAVQDFLIRQGIDAARLSTEGKGESEPVASNDTAEGRYQNRRVELHVAKP